MDSCACVVAVEVQRNRRNSVLRDPYSRQRLLHESDVLLDSALDPAGDGVIEDGVRCKYRTVPVPVAIIDSVAIPNQQVIDLHAVRELLLIERHSVSLLLRADAPFIFDQSHTTTAAQLR